jgi:hypothetical protein
MALITEVATGVDDKAITLLIGDDVCVFLDGTEDKLLDGYHIEYTDCFFYRYQVLL